MRVSIEGIYAVDSPEPCHLLEVLIQDYAGTVPVIDFTQEVDGQPRENWQVPWDERVLNPEGTADVSGQFPAEVRSEGSPLRLAFFLHYIAFAKPLLTPAGRFRCRPSRRYRQGSPSSGTKARANRPGA